MFCSLIPTFTLVYIAAEGRYGHSALITLMVYSVTRQAECVCVCMGSLYHCVVACAQLGNGTGCRTATLAAPLVLTSGLLRYEAVLHSCGTSPVTDL